jgi:Ni,Fe-hydrogenase maturation factor
MDNYIEKLVEFQGKEPGSIKILKKDEVIKDKEREKLSNIWSRNNHLHSLTLRTYLTLTSVKGALHSCGKRREVIPSMMKLTTFYGLAPT